MHSLAAVSGSPSRLFALSAVLSLAAAQAAPTGYSDDFSGAMRGWADNSSYRLSQQDGTLVMQVDKSTKWTGEWLGLGGEHDFSANPYVNLRAKTDTPCILHIYLNHGENSELLPRKLRAVDGYVTLSYDFSGAKQVDLKKVQGVIFAVNGAANSWSGRITIDDLKLGDAAKPPGLHRGRSGPDRLPRQRPTQRPADRSRRRRLVQGPGAEDLIRNASVGPVQDGMAMLTYECIPGATGKGR